MTEAVLDPMTNTYKVDNKDGTFSTYTPKQYEEKFGAVPEEKEDVADVETVEETVEEALKEDKENATDENPVAQVSDSLPAGVDLKEGQAVKTEDGKTMPVIPTQEQQEEIDEMVDYTITEETASQFPALPDGTELKAGDKVSLAKNHPLVETPVESKSILDRLNPLN